MSRWTGNPNSQNQLWSRWIFKINTSVAVPAKEVKYNTARWLRATFGSSGRAKVSERVMGYLDIEYEIVAEVEGPPANDHDYVAHVKKRFARFVDKGFGPLASHNVSVRILSGNAEDGNPSKQLIVMN